MPALHSIRRTSQLPFIKMSLTIGNALRYFAFLRAISLFLFSRLTSNSSVNSDSLARPDFSVDSGKEVAKWSFWRGFTSHRIMNSEWAAESRSFAQHCTSSSNVYHANRLRAYLHSTLSLCHPSAHTRESAPEKLCKSNGGLIKHHQAHMSNVLLRAPPARCSSA